MIVECEGGKGVRRASRWGAFRARSSGGQEERGEDGFRSPRYQMSGEGGIEGERGDKVGSAEREMVHLFGGPDSLVRWR